MKRIFTLIAVAIVVATVPVVAQKTKRTNEAISRASELMKDARYEESGKIIDSLLAINPNNSDALYLRSNALLENDSYEEALDYCNRAIEHHARKNYYDDSWLYYCRANIEALLGKYDDAIADLSQALELTEKKDDQHRARIHYTRAKCYSDIGDYTNTEADLMAASMYDSGDMRADITLALADTYYKGHEYEKSITACNVLIEMWEYPAEAYRIGAYSLIAMEFYETAIDCAISMAKIDFDIIREDELRWMLWHDVEYARKRLRESIAEDDEQNFRGSHFAIALFAHDYKIALSLLDVMSDVLSTDQIAYCRADYSAKLGRYDDAVRHITELIDAKEDALEIYYLTAERCGYYRLAGEYEKALADADRLVELIPDEAYGHYQRGWIYELMGNDEAAMENYNRGIEVDNSYAYIYLVRGEHYLKYGDTERAKADLERVLELDTDPTDGSARHYALHFLGRDDEAIEWMERLIDLDPYDAGTRYDEACLYARMGNVERALDALRMALYLGYKAKVHIENDDDLDPIRHTEAYQQLMEEYFNE